MAEAIAPAAEVEEDQANYAAIWKAALALYIDDCQTALHGKPCQTETSLTCPAQEFAWARNQTRKVGPADVNQQPQP